MPTQTLSAFSTETERPLSVDYFEPDLREFETISWSWLPENELTLLAAVRKFMPDAEVARRTDGGAYVLSRAASVAFQIPIFEPRRVRVAVLEDEDRQSA